MLLTILRITLSNSKKRKLYVIRRRQNIMEGDGSLFQQCNTHRYYRIFTIYDFVYSFRLSFLIVSTFISQTKESSENQTSDAHFIPTLTSYRRLNLRRATNVRHNRRDRRNCPKIANVRKNVNVHADLRFATIAHYRTRQSRRVRIRDTLLRNSKDNGNFTPMLEASTRQRSDATQQGEVKVNSNCV